ncbi:MAG TPA: serine/threonine-protein kinase, partial [Planctomycetota bacterium]
MSTQADFDFGNALVELDLAPLDRVREGLKILRESSRAGDSLERILLERGLITPEKAAMAHRRLKEAGSVPPQTPEEKSPPGAPEIPGYRIIAELGSGTAGTVYRARQLSMDRTVAIKVLAPRLAKDHAYLDRFFREAKAAARLSHPNLITAHDVGAHKGTFYIVMEYVEGATLQQMLDSRGTLDEALVVDAGLQVAKALEVAHRHGLVHRDVKPANILLGSTGVAKLCDLGLARQSGREDPEGRAVGTPRYISPEQARDDPGVDIRSDLYSLGATMYHLVTGQIPFQAETGPQMLAKHVSERLVPARERNPRVSAPLSAVISRLMEKNPAQRIQRPSDLVTALESIKASAARVPARPREIVRPSPATTQAPMPVPRLMPPRAPLSYGRRRGGGAGKYVAFLVIVGLGVGAWFYRDQIGSAISTRDPSKLIPGPLNPTPGPDAAALEEAARKDLEELDEAAAQDASFENLPGVLKRFEDFRRRYRDTKCELEAMDRRSSYLKRADLVAQAELESIRDREKELLAADRYRDVHQLYSRFPKKFLDTTPTGDEVRKRLNALAERISEKFAKHKRDLQELIRQR